MLTGERWFWKRGDDRSGRGVLQRCADVTANLSESLPSWLRLPRTVGRTKRAAASASLLVLGTGTVGGHLLLQLQSRAPGLEVVGLGNSKRVAFDRRGLGLADWKSVIARGAVGSATAGVLDALAECPRPVLVDCTAAEGMEALYQAAFRRGIHVVTANKKPLAIAWVRRQTLFAAAAESGRRFHYETTVGASLPIIAPLQDLIRTGDEVRLIEGCVSGTLGYLCQELMEGVTLSAAVQKAQELGYTEPRPQEDLSGMDVARKALILARELGLPLSLEDVEIEPFVPRALIDSASLDALFEGLRKSDAQFAEQIALLKSRGQVLRYLARVERPAAGNARIHVGPAAVSVDHAAAHLRGPGALIAFHSDRYRHSPLVVHGPGAGGEVTAAGVLSDILKISEG